MDERQCTAGSGAGGGVAPGGNISCAGATNWFGIGQGLGINNENPTVPLTGFRVLVNDVEYPYDIDPGFFAPYNLPEDYPIPEGIQGAAIQNKTGDYLRLEYQLLPANQDQYTLMFFGDNPCIIELGTNHWGVCLSPAEYIPTPNPASLEVEWERDVNGSIKSAVMAKASIQMAQVNTAKPMTYEVRLMDANGAELDVVQSGNIVTEDLTLFLGAYPKDPSSEDFEDTFAKLTVTVTGYDDVEVSRSTIGKIKPMTSRLTLLNNRSADQSNNPFLRVMELYTVNPSTGQIVKTVATPDDPKATMGITNAVDQLSTNVWSIDNVTEHYLVAKIKVGVPYGQTPALADTNANLSATLEPDQNRHNQSMLYVDLSPRQLEVLLLPSGTPNGDFSVKTFADTVNISTFFKRKYPGLVPDSTMQIRFIVPSYQNIVKQAIQSVGNGIGVDYLENTDYQSAVYAGASVKVGHALIVGNEPTYPDSDRVIMPFAWHGAKLLIQIDSWVSGQGGMGAPYYTDEKDRASKYASLVYNGQSGWSTILNLNNDCSVRVIVTQDGYYTSGGGGAGIGACTLIPLHNPEIPGSDVTVKVPCVSYMSGAPKGETGRNPVFTLPYRVQYPTLTEGGDCSLENPDAGRPYRECKIGFNYADTATVVLNHATGGAPGSSAEQNLQASFVSATNGYVQNGNITHEGATANGDAGFAVTGNAIECWWKPERYVIEDPMIATGGAATYEWPRGFPKVWLDFDEWDF